MLCKVYTKVYFKMLTQHIEIKKRHFYLHYNHIFR